MSALGWYAMIFAGVPTKICSLMCGIGIGALIVALKGHADPLVLLLPGMAGLAGLVLAPIFVGRSLGFARLLVHGTLAWGIVPLLSKSSYIGGGRNHRRTIEKFRGSVIYLDESGAPHEYVFSNASDPCGNGPYALMLYDSKQPKRAIAANHLDSCAYIDSQGNIELIGILEPVAEGVIFVVACLFGLIATLAIFAQRGLG